MSDAPDPPVLTRVEGRVGHVTLNRPHARNAVTIALADDLHDALVDLAPQVAVIVVRGAGGTFSAGGDVDEVARLAAEGPAALRMLFERFGRACSLVASLPVPVVSVVEGHAMAGGFEFMQASDVVLVRDDAVIADNHLAVGQVPGGGGSQRLPRLVGTQRALPHMLLGDRLDGRQAVAWGLAYRSAPADEFDPMVDAVVARLASRDPKAVARTKRLVHEGLRLPLEEGLTLEVDVVVEHLGDGAAERLVRAMRRS